MNQIIETLLRDPVFIYIGAIAAIIISLSILKKLFKFVIYTIVLLFIFGIYVVQSDKNPKQLLKDSEKAIEKTINFKEKIKKTSKNTLDDIKKSVPKEIKKSLKKVNEKKVKKTTKAVKKQINNLLIKENKKPTVDNSSYGKKNESLKLKSKNFNNTQNILITNNIDSKVVFKKSEKQKKIEKEQAKSLKKLKNELEKYKDQLGS